MKRKRGRPKAKPRDEQRRERVMRYLDSAYGGNQCEAARELGVSQSLISRIVNDERPVTDQLLDLIAAQPAVNSRWVYEGEGSMFLPSTAGTLPVSSVILPGPPNTCRQLLEGDRHPVAQDRERDTRYWHRLGTNSPLVDDLTLRMMPDDKLLMETHPDHLYRLDVIDERLCAVALDYGTATRCVFAITFVVDGKVFAKLFVKAASTAVESPGRENQAKTPTSHSQFLEQLGRRRYRRPSKMKEKDEHTDVGEKSEAPKETEASRVDEASPVPTNREAGKQVVELPSVEQVVGLVIGLERSVDSVGR